MNTKHIELLAKECAPVVESITGKSIKLDDLKVIVDDQDYTNDEDILKMKKILETAKENYDWKDSLFDCSPSKLAKKLGSYIAIKCMGKVGLMKVNDEKTLQVNPDILNEKETVLKNLLYHELLHLQDLQHYPERRYDFLEKISVLERKLTGKKHEAGLVQGYLKPNEEVKNMQKNIDSFLDEINNYATVDESHATYVQEKCKQKTGLNEIDCMSKTILKKSLATLPLMVLPLFKKKMKQYYAGNELVKMAYLMKVDMGLIYKNVPTQNDFKNPEAYLKKISGKTEPFSWNSIIKYQ